AGRNHQFDLATTASANLPTRTHRESFPGLFSTWISDRADESDERVGNAPSREKAKPRRASPAEARCRTRGARRAAAPLRPRKARARKSRGAVLAIPHPTPTIARARPHFRVPASRHAVGLDSRARLVRQTVKNAPNPAEVSVEQHASVGRSPAEFTSIHLGGEGRRVPPLRERPRTPSRRKDRRPSDGVPAFLPGCEPVSPTGDVALPGRRRALRARGALRKPSRAPQPPERARHATPCAPARRARRSEEHTSELQSRENLVRIPPMFTLFPYTTPFRSDRRPSDGVPAFLPGCEPVSPTGDVALPGRRRALRARGALRKPSRAPQPPERARHATPCAPARRAR